MIKKISLSFLGILGLLTIVGTGLYTNVIKLPITKEMHPSWAYDIGNTKILTENAHNIFLGKVIKEVGGEDSYGVPYTFFSVKVLANIKNHTEKIITVRQMGGYQYGILHVVKGGDVVVPGDEKGVDKEFLLKSEHVYVFAANRNEEGTRYTVSAFPYDYQRVTTDTTLSDAQALGLARQNPRVQEFVNAARELGVLNPEWDAR